jgi:hypothetical protein
MIPRESWQRGMVYAGFLLRRGFPMRLLVQSALCMDFTWENPSAPIGPMRLLVRKIRYIDIGQSIIVSW